MIGSEPSWLDRLKTLAVAIFSLLVISAAGYYIYGLYQSKTDDCALRTKSANPVTNCVSLEKVDSKESRAKGLSGRPTMNANQAMLFVFDSPGKQCMWMKDMNFNIDIIWLDSDKKITSVKRNVSPKTYPNNFCGGNKDKYVIETAAGAIDDDQISVGKQLNF
ncbi:DUF192 domain-containing protein [Candidatus Saccharibacteria bacterium]|nr:DUF192 domain-containing protein [Candidatus Saccharibacteria bacterium]